MNQTHEPLHRRGAEDAEAPQRELTEKIIAAAIEVHRHLGPGLLESVYQEALTAELRARDVHVANQRLVPVSYKGRPLCSTLRLDMLVNDAVIVEVKSVAALEPVHHAQLLTYLRLTGVTAGLLLNFNEATMRQSIKRISNSLRSSADLCASAVKSSSECRTMPEVRANIDALDEQIVALLARRSGFVAQAARIKQHESQIVDLERVEFIVERVKRQARQLGAPDEVVEAAYRALIGASIEFERRQFGVLHGKA